MTIAEKLQTIINIKADIKEAINEKGVSVTDSDSFASYADKIKSIETASGGSSGGSGDDLIYLGFNDDCINEDNQYEGNTSLTSVYLPQGYTLMNDYVFKECSQLTTVKLSDNVTISGRSTFEDCENLVNVTFGDNITIDGTETFFSCTSISNLKFGNNMTIGGHAAFRSCYGLKEITLPYDITITESGIFYNCKYLQKVWVSSTATFKRATNVASSVFYFTNSSPILYTDVADEDTAVSQWGTYWNNNLEVVYGATYEEYQNVPVTTALNVDTEDEDTSEDVMPEDVDNEDMTEE